MKRNRLIRVAESHTTIIDQEIKILGTILIEIKIKENAAAITDHMQNIAAAEIEPMTMIETGDLTTIEIEGKQ